MPDLSSNQTTIRGARHWARVYVSTPPEAEVLRGTVSASVAEPLTSITYTNVSGSASDVEQDMEVEVFRSGVSLGRLRVAPGGATSTVLQVEEISRGRMSIAVSDQIRVYRSWRLRTRLVGMTDALLRDSRVAVGTYTTSYRPVPISGGGYAGFVNGSNIITVAWSAAASYTVDPDSGGTVTYLWDVDDGTITVGTSTSASITATFPPGFRWVTLTVTDASNSVSATQHIPVWAHERTGANAPQEVFVQSLTADKENGWQCVFETKDGSTQTDLPDGALVYMWEESYYDNTEAAYGSPITGRSHIRFVGYLDEDTSTTDPESDEAQQRVEFRAVSPLLRMAQLVGFSQAVERVSSSSSWLEATGLSTSVMMDYIVRWGTTLQVCHDWINASTGYTYPAFYLQANTPFTQLKELVESVDAVLTCDRIGRVLIYQDALISSTSVRNGLATTLTLTEDDLLRISGNRKHWYRYAQLEGRGITAGTTESVTQDVYSRAPGLAPADAPQFTERDRLIIDNQTDLNNRTGHRYARDNSLYYGLPVPENVEIVLKGGYDVFDMLNEWVDLNVGSTYDGRGIGWNINDGRYVITNISVEYNPDDGSKTVTLTLQGETIGYAGVFYRPPEDPSTDLVITPIELDFPHLGFEVTLPTTDPAPNNLPVVVYAVGGGANEISRLVNFNYADGTGTAEDMDASNTTTGAPLWAFGDPFVANRFFVLTTDGLWKTDDRTATNPTWTQIADNADITGNASHISPYGEMSINRQGFIAVQSGNALCTSFDYGATWTQTAVDGGSVTTSSSRDLVFGFAVSPYNNRNASGQGWIYASYAGAANTRKVAINTTWGRGTWTEIDSQSALFSARGEVAVPYTRANGVANRNDSNQRVVVLYKNTGNQPTLRSIRRGGSEDWEFQYTNGSTTDRPSALNFATRVINVLTLNGSYVRVLTDDNFVSESSIGGSDLEDLDAHYWPNEATPHTTTRVGGGNINGWGSDHRLLLSFGTTNGSAVWDQNAGSGWLYYTPDAGTTWHDLAAVFGFADDRTQYAEMATA